LRLSSTFSRASSRSLPFAFAAPYELTDAFAGAMTALFDVNELLRGRLQVLNLRRS
jgi:hypothetical protein